MNGFWPLEHGGTGAGSDENLSKEKALEDFYKYSTANNTFLGY